MAFERRFLRLLPFGVCVAVSLPGEPASGDLLSELPPGLHADEATFARALPPSRRVSWVGGRLALRAALAAIGIDAPAPILATARGAPALPAGAVGSISHKRDVAVALAAMDEAKPGAGGRTTVGRTTVGPATVGIDVEEARVLRQDIGRHVLTPAERAALPAAGPARDAAVLLRFSAKEAIYKALDPWVSRFVSFQEAEIDLAPDGALAARLSLAASGVAEGPFGVELHDASNPAEGLILVAARVRRVVG